MSEQPTPRTDEIEPQCEIDTGGCEDWCCKTFPCPTCKGKAAVKIALNHARQLECELARETEARKEAVALAENCRQNALDMFAALEDMAAKVPELDA